MIMELTRYEVFADAAKTGNFTKTADRMGYTQPGVSRTLRLLERELGFPLFCRSKNGVELTSSGQEILPYVRRLLAEYRGDLPVVLFCSANRKQMLAPRSMWVYNNLKLIHKLRFILGEENVIMK